MGSLKTGEKIKVMPTISPKGITNGLTITGIAVDRLGFRYAALVIQHGAATGTPLNYSVPIKLEESSDNSVWADVTSPIATYNADSNTYDCDVLNIDLIGRKRYIRASATATINGGSSPAMPLSATFILSGPYREPTVQP